MGTSNFKYSDINISKREDWGNFIELMQLGKYTEALAVLQGTSFENIATTATFWNTLFNYIVNTEELKDDTFKSTKIQTSLTAPADLTTGQIYFKVKS